MGYECTRKNHYWRKEQNPDETVPPGSALTVPESRIQTENSKCFTINCPREQNPDETVRTGSALTIPESRIQTKHFKLLLNWLSQRAEPWRNGSNWFSLDCPREQNSDKTFQTASELAVPKSRTLTKRFHLVQPWLSQRAECWKKQFELLQNWLSQRAEFRQKVLNGFGTHCSR
jgi:hypothetical protein